MRVLLDTSVLLGPDPNLGEAEVAISAMSLAELHFGVLVAKTPEIRAERLRRLTLVERSFDALPVDDLVAREYGRLAAAVAATGWQPRVREAGLLIAATAAVHGAVMWTGNADDLIGLDGLVAVHDAR